MIAILQRVKRSSVKVNNKEISKIGEGINILLGVVKDDDERDIEKLINKIVNLRIFPDQNNKMNLSILDTKKEALVVSQFTLAADVKKGRRPSFDNAKNPKEAKMLYEKFCKRLKEFIEVKEGIFGAMMEVEILNDGPVTFIIDSKNLN